MMCDQLKLETRWRILEAEAPKIAGVTPARNPLKMPPPWYDEQRFRNAQKLAQKYLLR